MLNPQLDLATCGDFVGRAICLGRLAVSALRELPKHLFVVPKTVSGKVRK